VGQPSAAHAIATKISQPTTTTRKA
jgi:hypothetical protein